MANSKSPATPPLSAKTPMKVKAAPGVCVPIEGAARKYITDDAEVLVMRTAYYIRRVKDGDLIRTDLSAAAEVKTASVPVTVPVQTRGVASEA